MSKRRNQDDNNNKKSRVRKTDPIKSLINRIEESNISENGKEIAIQRLTNGTEYEKYKAVEWCENLLKIPFKKMAKLPVNKKTDITKIHDYFDKVKNILDEAVYDMQTVKDEIIQYIAQFISTNNKAMPRILGLVGVAGCGKTKIIRTGLSPCLNRPIKCISMGGIRDSSHFTGFEYTYAGSRYGMLVQSLIETKVMNPIIFMDELDKVSTGHDGQEIINMLIHITDPVQNHTFTDKYFSEINIDLSKVVFIFSFNDEKLIHPILKDRIHIVKVPDPDLKAKVIIGKNYLPKEILPNIGFDINDFILSENILKFIIQEYCSNDKGIRGLKHILESIFLKINAIRYMKTSKYKSLKTITFPLELTESIVSELIIKKDDSYDYMIKHMFT
jgi:ATP-dependent Lon protease